MMHDAAPPPATATQRVVQAIQSMVADGRLAPGAHVAEPFLAISLGVSRGPVREACRALVERGLLTAKANRGCFVRMITTQEAADLLDVRAALARLAGRILAVRITAAQLADLADIAARHEAASDASDLMTMQALNTLFHTTIIALTGNPRLQAIEAGMENELAIYRGRTAIIPSRNAEHAAIVDALRRGDPDAAGEAMELHMLNSKQRLLQTLSPD